MKIENEVGIALPGSSKTVKSSDNMVERVARSLAWDDIRDEVTRWLTPTTKADMWVDPKFERAARAAIEAMREPTEKMLNDAKCFGVKRGLVRAKWQAMIDAALEEK